MTARLPNRSRRGRRALVAGGFALCVVLAPGTALAEDDPAAPLAPVTDVLEGDQPQAGVDPAAAAGEEQADETPQPPPFEIPPEVIAAFQQLAAQAGISEDCVTGVADSLELIGNGVAGLPGELQQLVTDLGTAVQESIETQDPTALEDFLSGLAPAPEEGSEDPPAPPIGGDITAGLEQLAEVLQSDACKPAAPAERPPAQNPPAAPPASYQPPQAPPPPPQAPIQPAVYPGYAPTGADADDDGPSPVAVGAILALVAAGAGWAEWRRHAAPR